MSDYKALYQSLVDDHGIYDYLSLIPDLSYKKKYELVTFLLRTFGKKITNLSLHKYKVRYIEPNRIFVLAMPNQIKALAKDIEIDSRSGDYIFPEGGQHAHTS